MINTDKYEGHTPATWEYFYAKNCDDWILKTPLYIHSGKGVRMKKDSVDAQLIADAPLLLAEVKRLQKENDDLLGQINEYEDVIQPKDHKRIERLEKRIEDLQKGLPRCSCPTVDVCGGDSRGIIVAIGFDDGEEFSGYLDRSEW